MPRYPIGTPRSSKNSPKHSAVPSGAGTRASAPRKSAVNSTAAPIRCSTPNRMRSEGMAVSVTAVSSSPQPKITPPRRSALRP